MATGARPPIDLTADQREIVAVGKAIKAEADGKLLRRELVKAMRQTATPLVGDLKTSARMIPSDGLTRSQPLRQAIEASIKPTARLSGASTGVSVRARQTPGVRGFKMAARRMNKESFRRRVFGGDEWVVQVGDPGWFDNTVKGRRDGIKRDVLQAVERVTALLASRTRGN